MFSAIPGISMFVPREFHYGSKRSRHDAPEIAFEGKLRQVLNAPSAIHAAIQNSTYHLPMGANINLDADAYAFASTYASAKGIPVGAAISELLRRAQQAPEPASSLLTSNKRRLLVKAKAGCVVTPERVKALSEGDLEPGECPRKPAASPSCSPNSLWCKS
jgi:hypothetical protein